MIDEQQLINLNYYYYNKTDIDTLLSSYAKKSHTHSNYLTNASLNTKVDIAQGSNNALKNVVTDANGNITTENKQDIPTKVSDLTNDAGYIGQTELNNINTQINTKVNVSDIQNNLTSTATNKPLSAKQGKDLKALLNNKAESNHSHTTNEITDPNAYANIGSSANAPQSVINSYIDTKLSSISNGNVPTAHASSTTVYGVGDANNYGHVKVDTAVNANSANPVENRVIKDYVDQTLNDVVSGNVDISQTHNHDDRYYTEAEVNAELNNKLNTSIQISDNSDLNSFITTGFYYYPSTSKAKNILNYPEADPTTLKNINADAFTLIVEKLSTSSIKQTLTKYSTTTIPRTFIRTRKADQSWMSWSEISFSNHTHSEYLTQHQDISNKIDTAGTGLNKDGTTLNHSNSVTAQTSTLLKKIKYDGQGHITGVANVTKTDITDLGIPASDTTYNLANGTTNGLTKNNFSDTYKTTLDNLGTVATTNNYNDLDNLPSIPQANGTNSNIKMDSVANAGSLSTFAKADHTHPINGIIPKDANLNEWVDLGFYYHSSIDNAKTILNYPGAELDGTYSQATAFTLLVERIAGASYKQTLTQYASSNNVKPKTFIRTKITNSGWTDWQEVSYKGHTHSSSEVTGLSTVATTNDYNSLNNKPSIPQANTNNNNILGNGVANAGSLNTFAKANHVHPINAPIKAEDNLNDYIIPGFYYCTGNTIGKDVLNYPECDPITLKKSNANGFTLLVEKLNDSSTKQTLTVYNSTNVNPRTFIRIKLANSTGNWNDWKEIEYKGHGHSANDITGLSTVATSGSYTDLTDTYEHPPTHPASMITGLSTVATTGSYNSLSNKPSVDTTAGGVLNSNNLITSNAVYSGLSSKSDKNHSHNKKWKIIAHEENGIKTLEDGSTENTGWNNQQYFVSLFYNEPIGLCYLIYYREFASLGNGNIFLGDDSSETAWTHFAYWIPEQYRPVYQVQGSFNYIGNLIITTSGSIMARFGEQATAPGVRGTAMWMPRKDVDVDNFIETLGETGYLDEAYLEIYADSNADFN